MLQACVPVLIARAQTSKFIPSYMHPYIHFVYVSVFNKMECVFLCTTLRLLRFVLPSMDGSPPKVMTLDEVADVVKNIQNMELVHEIALNPEFKLQPYEPPENR